MLVKIDKKQVFQACIMNFAVNNIYYTQKSIVFKQIVNKGKCKLFCNSFCTGDEFSAFSEKIRGFFHRRFCLTEFGFCGMIIYHN